MAKQQTDLSDARYARLFLLILGGLILIGLFFIAPYSALWLHESGDAAVERVVARQAKNEFALFGSGLSQDFIDYKLRLYEAVKPEIAVIGSSRVMQFRGAWFRESFVNMGGVAGNLAELRAALDAMIAFSKPKVLILGLDFWWFMPQWEKNPEERLAPTSGSYNYGLGSLKKPWEWYLEGKISFSELLAPLLGLFGHGFRADRYGIMAQQTSDGFGPDGSWYYTAEITGKKEAFDYRFHDTLANIRRGTRAFFHAAPNQKAPAENHLNVLAEIWCRLKSRGIQVYAFIPPMAAKALDLMDEDKYPHLRKLREALAAMGIDALDFTDPRSIGANDCEFVDGFHGGEVVYARILRRMADHWPALLAWVNMEKIEDIIKFWQGHALVPDERVATDPETDFLGLECKKNGAWGPKSRSSKKPAEFIK